MSEGLLNEHLVTAAMDATEEKLMKRE